MIEVSHNLDALNRTLAEYQRVSGLTTAQVLIKKGSDLSFRLSEKMKMLKAAKGSITAYNLAALSIGRGIKVRASIVKKVMQKMGAAVGIEDRKTRFGFKPKLVKGKEGIKVLKDDAGKVRNKKGLTLQNLIVKRELSSRESGRGYLAWAAMMNVKKLSATNKQIKHLGRLHQQLGDLNLTFTTADGSLTFHWGGEGHDGNPIQSGEAFAKPRQQRAISSALAEIRADIGVYLARKHAEALQASVDRAVKTARTVSFGGAA